VVSKVKSMCSPSENCSEIIVHIKIRMFDKVNWFIFGERK